MNVSSPRAMRLCAFCSSDSTSARKPLRHRSAARCPATTMPSKPRYRGFKLQVARSKIQDSRFNMQASKQAKFKMEMIKLSCRSTPPCLCCSNWLIIFVCCRFRCWSDATRSGRNGYICWLRHSAKVVWMVPWRTCCRRTTISRRGLWMWLANLLSS